jgi:hypothetical protein
MPCYSPLTAYRSLSVDRNGKHTVSFKKLETQAYSQISIACGQCIGCRLDRSRQWALRCVHESKLWPKNSFITLTYSDIHLPWDNSLKKRDFQLFMKRLRKSNPRAKDDPIRYYHCGEYGERTRRPHYHAIMFNYDPPDKKHWKTNRRTGEKYYTSEELNRIWGKGYCVIGEVTYESAAYVARYVLKKINGPKSKEHYTHILSYETGECVDLQPEYTTMSRKPGIGKNHYEQFKSDIYPSDFCVHKGKKQKVPRYYDRLYEIENESEFRKIKERRVKNAQRESVKYNNTPDRLVIREKVQQSKLNRLIRPEI